MTAEIETRFESESLYPGGFCSDPESITGYLSLRKPKSPLPTIELDEDSFFLAYSDWTSFVEYALGGYASRNPDKIATVYTYSTGAAPSVNYSRGEKHQKVGFHNAVFLGVVGRAEVLETIQLVLVNRIGVPTDLVENAVNPEKRSQIHCGPSPDYIAFNRMGQPSFHIEDGRVWAPYEQNVWYTRSDWRPCADRPNETHEKKKGEHGEEKREDIWPRVKARQRKRRPNKNRRRS